MSDIDLTNREFGDYHIIRRIGKGAMADVYLAEQRSLGRRIALKVLKNDLAADDSYVKRFVREARAVAKLSHQNLVQVYQADCLDGHWFIAQEYVQGQSLQQLIQRKGSLTPEQTAEILWCACAGLGKAAQEGIVHRDIKPDNILLGDDGEVKVADFGLARVNDPAGTKNTALTQAGMTLGTPLYMSPEQAQGKPLDHRSDMYSLGITAYHALTGQPPFRGETALAVAIQHVNKQAEPLTKLRPDIPQPLARIVHQMIEKQPDKRFKTFADIQRELRMVFALYMHNDEHAERLPDWSSFRLDAADTKILATTERLQGIMKAEHAAGRRRYPRFFWPAVLLFCGMIGGLFGYWRTYAAPSLLHPPRVEGIRKRATVAEQWMYACRLDMPDAWNSVIDDFPADEYFWGRKAKRQLIRYYFHAGEIGDTYSALPIFQEFAAFSDADADDKALGLAGLAWCAAENDENPSIVWDYLRQVFEVKQTFSDQLLVQLIDATNKKMLEKKPEH